MRWWQGPRQPDAMRTCRLMEHLQASLPGNAELVAALLVQQACCGRHSTTDHFCCQGTCSTLPATEPRRPACPCHGTARLACAARRGKPRNYVRGMPSC